MSARVYSSQIIASEQSSFKAHDGDKLNCSFIFYLITFNVSFLLHIFNIKKSKSTLITVGLIVNESFVCISPMKIIVRLCNFSSQCNKFAPRLKPFF